VVVKDFSYARVLDRLLMYERRIEHSLYRTMGELQRQRSCESLTLRRPNRRRKLPRRFVAGPCGASVPSTSSEPALRDSRTGQALARLKKSGGDAQPTKSRVTTNAPAASTEPLASPDLSLNRDEVPASREMAACCAQPDRFAGSLNQETGTDSAKQSQFGAGQITANLFLYEGLRQEGQAVVPQKQSQFSGVALAGDGFGLDTERARRYNSGLTGTSCLPVFTEE
jgi:hypothetical protein